MGVSDSKGKCSPIYLVLKPKERTNANYVSIAVRFLAQIGALKILVNTIRFNSADFKRDHLKVIVVWLPPPEEQQAIANFLAHFDQRINRLISTKRRQIELLNEQKQAIIHRAVTRGLEPDVPLKPSGIDWAPNVPLHWEAMRIKSATSIIRGKFSHRPRNDPSFYGGVHPFVQTGDIARARKHIVTYKQTLNDRGLSVSKKFPAGTLVMAIAANIGNVALLDFDACFPDSVVGFSPHKHLERDFLYLVFVSMKQEFLREAPVNTQGNLNIERIGSLAFPMPPLYEQTKIVHFAGDQTQRMDKEADVHTLSIQALREYRSRLSADVVTGQLDIRNHPWSLTAPESPEQGDQVPIEDAELEELANAD